MAKQSRDVTILLTRPLAQSLRFAREVEQALPGVPILLSPLMVPEYFTPPIPPQEYAAVILVSTAAVEAARRISAAGSNLPSRAYCVGNRTAAAAKIAGFDAVSANGDATALLALIIADKPSGPLLFLRGHDSTGRILETLISAEMETVSIICYQQVFQALNPVAMDVLRGNAPVILPVFSPRSALLLQTETARISATSPLWVAALSPAIAAVIDLKTIARLATADHPNSADMILTMQSLTGPDGSP